MFAGATLATANVLEATVTQMPVEWRFAIRRQVDRLRSSVIVVLVPTFPDVDPLMGAE